MDTKCKRNCLVKGYSILNETCNHLCKYVTTYLINVQSEALNTNISKSCHQKEQEMEMNELHKMK